MSLSTEQLSARKLGLGASEVSSIFGLNPFQSEFDLWASKTGKVDDFDGNDATNRGNWLEAGILNYAEDTLGVPIVRNVRVLDPAGGVLAATLDADCPQLNAIIEAKSTTQDEEFGEPYSAQVPARFIIQTIVGMMCAGRALAYIPVLFPRYKRFAFEMFTNEFNPTLAQQIREKANQWWSAFVVRDIPPTDSIGTIEVLKRMKRVPSKIVDVPAALVFNWKTARKIRLDNEKVEATAEAALITAIGDAEAGNSDAGVVTYLETTQNRKAQEARVVTFRTLREKKGK